MYRDWELCMQNWNPAPSGLNLIHSPGISAHMMMNHQMNNHSNNSVLMIRLLWLIVCLRDVLHVSDAMLGNMLDVTLTDSSKYDSELHHLDVQMRQLTLPFLGEKQQFPTSCSEVQNAKADPPRKLESWKTLYFNSLKSLNPLEPEFPITTSFTHCEHDQMKQPTLTAETWGSISSKKLKVLMQEKNQLDSPKTEKIEEFICCVGPLPPPLISY